MRIWVIIITILFGLVQVQAQDKKAKRILDNLSDRYTALASIEIDFDLTIQYPEEEKVTYPSSVIQQDNKFVFKNSEHEYYGTGEDIWVYIADQNEVQINDFEEEESDDYFITPLDLLNQYKKDKFKYHISSDKGITKELEFVPTDEFADYSKFRITVDSKKLEINHIIGFGKDGAVVTIDISKVLENKSYPESIFIFDKSKYPGVRIEDLRL